MRRSIGIGAISLLTLLVTVTDAQSDAQSDPAEAGRALGASGNNQAAGATSTSPNSYPVYQGNNPDNIQHYYTAGTGIQSQAQEALATASANDPASTAVNQAVAGPQFSIAPTDPTLVQGQAIASQATALTQTYSGCQQLKVAQSSNTSVIHACNVMIDAATEQCSAQRTTSCPANAPTTSGVVNSVVNSDAAFNYVFPTLTIGTPTDNALSGNCEIHTQTTQFQVSPALLKTFMLTYAGYDDYMQVLVNGKQAFNGPYNGDMLEVVNGQVQYSTSGKTAGCELKTNWRQPLSIDLRPYVGSGSAPVVVTITMRVEVGGGGEGWSVYTIENYPDCSANDQWTLSCPQADTPTSCLLESQVCTDGPGTKTVDGTVQYRQCWAYTNSYLCQSTQQQLQSSCASYFSQGCTQTSSTCLTYQNGICTQYQQMFSCPASTAPVQTVTLCGSDLYCPDGNCTSDLSTYQPATVTDLAQSSTYLQAAQDAATDNLNTAGEVSFFKGEGAQCSQAAVGYANCCSDTGWGADVGLAQCTTEEATLGLARQAGQTHFVGTYSTGSLVLKTTYQVYCQFSSLLSRIIQEQGRPQIGLDWGAPESPNCRAFTQAEMSQLNFEAMDFSEFYAYAEAQANAAMANIPTNAAIQQQLQQQLLIIQQNPGISDGTSTGP